MGSNKLKQAAAQVLALNLPADKIREIQASFKAIDKDGSGHISYEEFKEGMMVTKMKPKDVEAMFKMVDTDSTGLISYSEFVSACLMNSKLMTKDRIMQTFDRLDKDRSGTLSVSELKCVLRGIQDEEEVMQILTAADTDGDGVISRKEFLAAVQAKR